MCLAQGPQRSDAGETRTRGPSEAVRKESQMFSPGVQHIDCDREDELCEPFRREVDDVNNDEYNKKLEDLKVLRRSPDLLNNVKIGQGQLQLIMEQILFLPYTFWSSDLNNLTNNPSNSRVISEKKMFR